MDIYDVISKVGFPIFVATFLLLRVDKTLREVRSTLLVISIAVKILAGLPGEDSIDEVEEDE